MKSIRSVLQGERSRGFTRPWGVMAALAALAVALAAVGAPPGGAQAEVLPTGTGEYGKAPRTADARLAATDQRAPDADASHNQLGEAYRPVVHIPGRYRPEHGLFSIGAKVVFLEWYASTSNIDGNTDVSCDLKRNDGWSQDVTQVKPFQYNWDAPLKSVVKVTGLSPKTTYQFWIECRDGSSVLKVGPKGEITTLKRDALKAKHVRVEAGWGSVTVRWTKPKGAHNCFEELNGTDSGYATDPREFRGPNGERVEQRFKHLPYGTTYEVKVVCGFYASLETHMTFHGKTSAAPISVTTKALLPLSGFEASTQKEDRIRVRWDELDEARYYLVAFTPNAKKGTPCATGSGSSGWQRAQKTKHLQTGLQPDTRYKVCLKAIGPDDITISPTESIFTRTASSGD